ncbi:MAG: Ig-like domain-containing protein [Peptoniphilaceae bacterium]|nr:Ig-like domain-containing protein [Peptoniphilaceae bacterium]
MKNGSKDKNLLNKSLQERKLKYGSRKLKIGLVSCILGSVVFLATPINSSADEEISENEITFEENEKPLENPPEDVLTENIVTDDTNEKEDLDKIDKENAPILNENLNEDRALDENLPETAENENQPSDVSDKLKNVKIEIVGNHKQDPNIIKPHGYENKDQADSDNYDTELKVKISFDVPSTVKENDIFKIDLSDNIDTIGANDNWGQAPDLVVGPDVLAKGSTQGNDLIFTFTDFVKKYGNVYGEVAIPIFINQYIVEKNSKENISVTIGKTSANKEIEVNYDKVINNQRTTSLYGNLHSVNEKDNTFEHILIVNPTKFEEAEHTVSVRADGENSGVYYDTDVLNSVKVYKLKSDKTNMSFVDEDLEEYTGFTTELGNVLINGTIKNGLTINLNDNNSSTDTFVIKYTGKFDQQKNVVTMAVAKANDKYGLPKGTFTWGNYHVVYNPEGTGKGDIGSFIEYHIYQTIKDGKITTDQFYHKDVTEGNGEEQYTTQKEKDPQPYKEGYELVSVVSPDTEAKFNEDGSVANGNYIPGRQITVKYIYQRTIEEKGSFQEHHIYITKDQDGVEVDRKEENGTVTECKKEQK